MSKSGEGLGEQEGGRGRGRQGGGGGLWLRVPITSLVLRLSSSQECLRVRSGPKKRTQVRVYRERKHGKQHLGDRPTVRCEHELAPNQMCPVRLSFRPTFCRAKSCRSTTRFSGKWAKNRRHPAGLNLGRSFCGDDMLTLPNGMRKGRKKTTAEGNQHRYTNRLVILEPAPLR